MIDHEGDVFKWHLIKVVAIFGEVVFSEETPFELIERIRPDVLIKGADSLTCELTENRDGVWRGKWLTHEQMAVNLVPIPDP